MSASTISAATLASVRGAIGRAAAKANVDFSYLLGQAQSESGLNPSAKARGSSATGLFQFLDQSWLGIMKQHGADNGLAWAANAIQHRAGGGYKVADPAAKRAIMALREDPETSAAMAAAYASDNAGTLTSALGRQVGATDLYMAHFLGVDGARRFLSAADASPDASAASLFPREANANRGIFYTRSGQAKSLGEVYATMTRKLQAAGAVMGESVQMASAAQPGDLVASPPGGGSGEVRLAYADSVLNGESDGQGDDTATVLAALGNARADVLKPNPAQARLAYLMLSATPLA